MITNLPPLPTIGAIAESLDATEQEVGRIIREQNIRPVARAGLARVFSLEAVEEIRREIQGDGRRVSR